MKKYHANNLSKLAFSALLLSGGMSAIDVSQAQISAGTSAITFTTQQIETGPVLDVVPYVLSDGYTINLTLIPSLVDFNNYATPPTIASVTAGLNVVQLPVVLPVFTVRQVVTTVNIWDNQTVVIGGLISSSTTSTKDKVPFLGDLPYLGRLFRHSSDSNSKQELLIFITPKVLNDTMQGNQSSNKAGQ